MKKIFIECCVESHSEALIAEKRGADQLELCSDLANDGLTPDTTLTEKTLETISIPLKVMIRHRKGDFFYDKSDISIIRNQINSMKLIGIKHIVFGSLTHLNRINLEQIKMVSEWAYPMNVTYHKAIDLSENFFEDTELLLQFKNVKSLLTSGQASTAEKGYLTLKRLLADFGKNIKIISAGSITDKNLNKIHNMIRGRYYHGRKILGELK
ncbi:MAG: copper homeostasis protein CutC [Candidatus Neomarinimicrobiota bacterium]|nr:copper homeostasis protein CutC [Candidatus Neomarinimicrobiota bacterium]MEC8706582.1 copper homeostasis protein CutC [Candidatus Neomarinimicrobiota bacterium]